MSVSVKLTRESSGNKKYYVFIVGSDERILNEGERHFSDAVTSYAIKKVAGIGYIYITKWASFLGARLFPFSEKEWLKEGHTRNYP